MAVQNTSYTGDVAGRSAGTDPASSSAAPGPSAAELLAAVGTGILVVAPDWRVAQANPAWWSLFAHPGDGAGVGGDLWRAVPALAVPEIAAMLRQVAAVGHPGAAPVAIGGRAVELAARRLAGGALLLEARDVTALVARERRAASETGEADRLRDLAHAMAAEPDGFALMRLLCDAALERGAADGVWVLEPREGERGYVVAAAGMVADTFGLDLPLDGSLMAEALLGGVPVLRDAYAPANEELRALGRRFGVGPVLMVPLWAHGQPLGVLAAVRREGAATFGQDDAERVRVIAHHASLALYKAHLVDEAHAAARMRSNFLATVSHELRTPLTALTGYGELLADGILGPMPREQHDVVERMRAVTHHLAAMIDEILTFSSLEAGSEMVRRAPVQAGEVVQEALTVAEPLARAKGIVLAVRMREPALTMQTDGDKLRQILVNLTGNAIKFTDAGEVALTVECSNGEVAFRVRDTGPGIPADGRARLFQPFSQLSSGLTRRHGGTGLGLYISRRLAALLGGRIDLESEVGRGSEFTLVLPVE